MGVIVEVLGKAVSVDPRYTRVYEATAAKLTVLQRQGHLHEDLATLGRMSQPFSMLTDFCPNSAERLRAAGFVVCSKCHIGSEMVAEQLCFCTENDRQVLGKLRSNGILH